jgi:transcriptional regulator with XRE-family HTH domain
MLIEHLGNALRERRKALGLTQPDLAELAQMSTNTLYKLERGQGNPTWEVLSRLVEVLGMEFLLVVKK